MSENSFLTLLRSRLEERTVPQETAIYEAGAQPEGAYYLISGRVRLVVNAVCGKTLVTRVVRPGEFFGIAPLFSNRPHDGSAEAVERSVYGFIPKDALFTLIEESSDARLPILSILSEDVNGCRLFIRLAGRAA